METTKTQVGAKEYIEGMSIDAELNDFAIRSFRNIADGDYIAARMACRARLAVQFLWSSQQAIEKYILLLNRIPACNIKHDLTNALQKINNSKKIPLELTAPTKKFIDYVGRRVWPVSISGGLPLG